MSTRVVEAARRGGYVLDGFPRTLEQALAAYSWAQGQEGVTLQAVVHLRASETELHTRLRARAEREGRNDDNEAVMTHRFEVFDVQTRPLLGFYAERGLLVEVDGAQPADDVFADITGAVETLLREHGTSASRQLGTDS